MHACMHACAHMRITCPRRRRPLQVRVPAEAVVLGKDVSYPSFGWDNEYGHKEIDVQAFRWAHCRVA